MTLALIIAILLVGGACAAWSARSSAGQARAVTLLALGAATITTVSLLPATVALTGLPGADWVGVLRLDWIHHFGISFHLAADGLSMMLILLTLLLGFVCVLVSWTEITERVGFFHLNLLWTLAGVIGVFCALDLFLFFVFWEVMLVPMYFLISIWGHEKRAYAAMKFFIFTQASSLLMLISMIALVMLHYRATGTLTFDYLDLLQAQPAPGSFWLMAGFFIAFAVKLPTVPWHTWLPDAHTQAPTAGSVILAGVLLKTGAYGLIRFVVPLFPDAALAFTPWAMLLGVVGILYGALMAFAQDDFKRLVAYSSVSHMGFVLVGVFAWNQVALNGAIMQMLAHGISTSALFAMAGLLQHRLHTRDMRAMGGIWTRAPRLAAIALFFVVASVGMPGLGNFVGEFLVLWGTFQHSVLFAMLAGLGLVYGAVYSLLLVQRAFHGPDAQAPAVAELDVRELSIFALLAIAILWLGLYPGTFLHLAEPSLAWLDSQVAFRAAGP